MRPRALALLLLGLPWIAGCASRHYTLELESHRNLAASTETDALPFHVGRITDTSERPKGPLNDREVEALVRTALANRGMYPAPNAETAGVNLEIQYGAGNAKIELTEISNPSRGLHRAVRAEMVREKYFRMTARPPGTAASPQGSDVLWTVEVRNTSDETGDIRRYLPIIIAVAAEWAAKNTHGRRSFVATMENGTVIIVSGGYDQPGISPDAPK